MKISKSKFHLDLEGNLNNSVSSRLTEVDSLTDLRLMEYQLHFLALFCTTGSQFLKCRSQVAQILTLCNDIALASSFLLIKLHSIMKKEPLHTPFTKMCLEDTFGSSLPKKSYFWSALMAISTFFSMYVVLGNYNFANFLGLLPFSEALLLSNGTSY